MSLIYDAMSEANIQFPAHGWTYNEKNTRILFFPVIQLYQHGQKYHKYFIDNNLAGMWLQARSPVRTLRNLTVCFRDLHKEIRVITPLYDFDDQSKSKEQKSADHLRLIEGVERIEVLLISAFTLLRRLPDELINTSRPFLFEHWKSAPREMKNAIPSAREGKLNKLNPICDLDILNDALCNCTDWFESLRAEKGIRDILIHRPHILQVGGAGSGNPTNWRVFSDLVLLNKDSEHKIDLIKSLLECIDGVCKFMECLCVSVDLSGGYYQQDNFIFLNGQDNDIVGFWPPIKGIRTEFPIMN